MKDWIEAIAATKPQTVWNLGDESGAGEMIVPIPVTERDHLVELARSVERLAAEWEALSQYKPGDDYARGCVHKRLDCATELRRLLDGTP